MDTYTDFRDLSTHETEGRDVEVIIRRGDPRVAVVAIHGGGIEPGTVDIACGVAGDDYTLYCFKGIKPSGNRMLHLTARRFDEPRGTALVVQADTVLSLHGCKGSRSVVYAGGLDAELCRRIKDGLCRAGFQARQSRRAGLRGTHPHNICNRGRAGRGVQLEISEGLRREFFGSLTPRPDRKKTEVYFRFVAVLRGALAAITAGSA
jgi:phage replication-related protein YjqB (UPF0714/DUF867 family)